MKASRELFERAADIIRERGHTKYALEEESGGPVCLWGALNIADHGHANYLDRDIWFFSETEVEKTLFPIVAEQFPDRVGTEYRECATIDFNNDPDTTPEEVIAVLEKAAVRASEEV